jgi:hypothetical protein
MENTAGSRDDSEGPGAKRRREAYRGKKCFVIMPFGEKEHPVTKDKINFDFQ